MRTNREMVAIMQENFRKRVKRNANKKKIDNASLVAESPMYFYCKYCGDHTETLPENFTKKPVTVCVPCHELEKLGAIPDA